MKSLIFLGSLSLLTACAAKNTAETAGNVTEILGSGQFTFMAERANPTNYDVMRVMNAIPNSTSTRMLELGRGYTLKISQKELSADLPYFGRVYSPSMDPDKAGIKFTTNNFAIDQSANKKGNISYKISVNNGSVRMLYLEVYKNGKAFLSIDSQDRQPITYDGYIMKNEAKN